MTVGAPLGDHTCIHEHHSFRHPCRLCGFEVEERERERENQRERESKRERERDANETSEVHEKKRTSRKKERKRAREREALRFQSPEGSFLALGSQAPVHNSQLNNIGA